MADRRRRPRLAALMFSGALVGCVAGGLGGWPALAGVVAGFGYALLTLHVLAEA